MKALKQGIVEIMQLLILKFTKFNKLLYLDIVLKNTI